MRFRCQSSSDSGVGLQEAEDPHSEPAPPTSPQTFLVARVDAVLRVEVGFDERPSLEELLPRDRVAVTFELVGFVGRDFVPLREPGFWVALAAGVRVERLDFAAARRSSRFPGVGRIASKGDRPCQYALAGSSPSTIQ